MFTLVPVDKLAFQYSGISISQMLDENCHLQSEGPSVQKKKKKRGRLMFSSKRALERSKMRPPKLKSQVYDVQGSMPMSIDFGDDDVADLGCSQNVMTYSDMIDQGESEQDIISDEDEGWQNVSSTLNKLYSHCILY
jgi:hypothetical protein